MDQKTSSIFQAVLSNFVAKRDKSIARINLLLNSPYDNKIDYVNEISKEIETLSHAYQNIGTTNDIILQLNQIQQKDAKEKIEE